MIIIPMGFGVSVMSFIGLMLGDQTFILTMIMGVVLIGFGFVLEEPEEEEEK